MTVDTLATRIISQSLYPTLYYVRKKEKVAPKTIINAKLAYVPLVHSQQSIEGQTFHGNDLYWCHKTPSSQLVMPSMASVGEVPVPLHPAEVNVASGSRLLMRCSGLFAYTSYEWVNTYSSTAFWNGLMINNKECYIISPPAWSAWSQQRNCQ